MYTDAKHHGEMAARHLINAHADSGSVGKEVTLNDFSSEQSYDAQNTSPLISFKFYKEMLLHEENFLKEEGFEVARRIVA